MKYLQLKMIMICCYFGIGCQNQVNKIYIEDYLKTTKYDSSATVGYRSDAMCYYKDSCSLYYQKVSYKRDLIYNQFSGPISTQWKNNPSTKMLYSSLKNKEFEYEMYDPLNGFLYSKSLIENDTLVVIRIWTKNKDCEFYKMKDRIKLGK